MPTNTTRRNGSPCSRPHGLGLWILFAQSRGALGSGASSLRSESAGTKRQHLLRVQSLTRIPSQEDFVADPQIVVQPLRTIAGRGQVCPRVLNRKVCSAGLGALLVGDRGWSPETWNRWCVTLLSSTLFPEDDHRENVWPP